MRIYALNVHRVGYFKQQSLNSTTEGCNNVFYIK